MERRSKHMAESFDQEQAIADYTRLMEAGPVAENEKELQALIERANAQGMYFDYDRESRAYVLVESQVVRYNREMDERLLKAHSNNRGQRTSLVESNSQVHHSNGYSNHRNALQERLSSLDWQHLADREQP